MQHLCVTLSIWENLFGLLFGLFVCLGFLLYPKSLHLLSVTIYSFKMLLFLLHTYAVAGVILFRHKGNITRRGEGKVIPLSARGKAKMLQITCCRRCLTLPHLNGLSQKKTPVLIHDSISGMSSKLLSYLWARAKCHWVQQKSVEDQTSTPHNWLKILHCWEQFCTSSKTKGCA